MPEAGHTIPAGSSAVEVQCRNALERDGPTQVAGESNDGSRGLKGEDTFSCRELVVSSLSNV